MKGLISVVPSGVYSRKPHMKNWRRLDVSKRAKVRKLLDGGWSQRSLAWSFGVSRSTIRRIRSES